MISWLLGQLLGLLTWPLSCLMSVLTWVLTPVPLTLLTALLTALYFWYTRKYNFWRERGVRGPTAKLPWGTAEYGNPFSYISTEIDRGLYYDHGGKTFCGYFEYSRPVLFVGNPEMIKTITIKDFDSFSDFRKVDSLTSFAEMLTSLSGEKWKHTRSVMSPTFSASKLKGMHDITLDNARSMAKYVAEETSKNRDVDIKYASNCFTMDNIADCAFGVHCNSYKDPNHIFGKHASKLSSPDAYALAVFTLMLMVPASIAKLIPDPIQSTTDFFADVIEKTIAERKRNGVIRRDYLQLLLDAKDKDGNPALTRNSMVQQCVLFFFAGYDTTASLILFASHSMAMCPDIQKRVQEEVDEVMERHGGRLDYEAVMDMPYLDRVLSETLRMYPPATRMERQVTKEYTLPETKFTLPVGTLLQIPVYMIHHDPDYYPNPEKFDPDRFLPEVKETRHPCTYIPFGSGPRNCIAMRFALFECKVALATMMKDLTLEPSDRTPPMPCPLDKAVLTPTPAGRKMYLRAVPRGKK